MTRSISILAAVKAYTPSAEEAAWLEQFDGSLSAWAALRYVLMFNTLNYAWLGGILAPDVTYESQSVFEKLEGIEQVGHYFKGKISTLKLSGSKATVLAELGTTPDHQQPCALMYQTQDVNDLKWRTRPLAYVEFKTDEHKVKEIFMVSAVPSPSTARRSKVYPLAELDKIGEGLVELPAFAELEFRVYLLDGKIGLDKKMLQSVEALAEHFPRSRTKVINSNKCTLDEGNDMADRNVISFPTLIIQWQAKQLLRFVGLRPPETLIEAVEELFPTLSR